MTYSDAVNFLGAVRPGFSAVNRTDWPMPTRSVTAGRRPFFRALRGQSSFAQLSTKAAAAIHRRFLQLYPDKPFPLLDGYPRHIGSRGAQCWHLATQNPLLKRLGAEGA